MFSNYTSKIFVSLTLLLLMGCRPADSVSIMPKNTPASTLTLSPAPPTKTPVIENPTVTPTPIPTVEKIKLPTSSIIQNKCPRITTWNPTRNFTKGILAVYGRMQPNLLLNLNSGEKIELNGDAPMVSPSRDKFANQIVDDNTLQYSIFIADPNDQKITQVLSKPDWFTASRWFDDQHLLIRTTNETPPYTVELFNPFTGETRALIPDFPGISQKEVDWEFSGPVSYDHSLVYAVYAFWDSDKAEHEYVLYNISSKTRLATLAGSSHETAYIFSGRIASRDGVSNNPPQWSPDDTSAAVISSAPEKPGAIDEIFAVTKDGEIQRLTYFANSYNTARINNLSWSPDGNSIAFWVSLDPAPYELPQNAYQNVNLAVLDTKTLEITIYCLNGDNIGETNGAPSTPKFLSYGVPAPIWSPDGTQLVIENRYADDNSRLLILDIPAGKSFELLKNVVPQGWMNPAPK